MYNVKVAKDYRWSRARVGGREFSKAGGLISGDSLTDEMGESPILVLEEVEPQPGPEEVVAPEEAEEGEDAA